MLRSLLIISISLIFFSCKNNLINDETASEEKIDAIETTYYLIRHAEKDRTDANNIDPKLTEKGLERARLWASFFDSIPLNEIYATNYHRTQQTAMYVSSDKQIPVELYEPSTVINEDFLLITKGKKTLLVGHSNTTPQLVNQLIGEEKYKDMADDDNASLFIVVLKGDEKSVQIEKIDF